MPEWKSPWAFVLIRHLMTVARRVSPGWCAVRIGYKCWIIIWTLSTDLLKASVYPVSLNMILHSPKICYQINFFFQTQVLAGVKLGRQDFPQYIRCLLHVLHCFVISANKEKRAHPFFSGGKLYMSLPLRRSAIAANRLDQGLFYLPSCYPSSFRSSLTLCFHLSLSLHLSLHYPILSL